MCWGWFEGSCVGKVKVWVVQMADEIFACGHPRTLLDVFPLERKSI
jgi:hypothetical protein